MRDLEFLVEQQRLRKKPGCNLSGIIAGSVGYLRLKFAFSKEWDGCQKVVSFWVGCEEFPVKLDADNSCVLPGEVSTCESFDISVTGARTKAYIIRTNKYTIKQEVIYHGND